VCRLIILATRVNPSNDVRDAPAYVWRRSPVRHNLLANLGGKGFSLVIGLICVPIYIRVLGIAAYGLIGVWMTLENISNLADLGLTATMTREMAACSVRQGGAQDARDLVRMLEIGYWLIGAVLGGVIIVSASPVASHWLHSSQLPPDTIRAAMVLIGVLIFCRWPVTFYGGGLIGLERQVLLNGIGSVYSFLRSLGSVFILLFISQSIFAFFIFQIAVNIVQTAVLTILFWRCLPPERAPRFRPELLRRIWRFAGGSSASMILWILVGEIDKIVISAMLPLESVGYYMLGSRVAVSLSATSSALLASFFPAFSREVAAGDERKLADLYHRASQMMSVLVIPATLTVIFFARPLIFAWTGKGVVADQTALIAAILTAGAALGYMVSVPNALQLAYGWTSLSVWFGVVSLCICVPLLLIFTKYFGAAGAASVRVLIGLGIFPGMAIMHRRLLTSEAKRWAFEDVGIPLIVCIAVAVFVFEQITWSSTRLTAGLSVVLAAAILEGVAILATPLTRQELREFLRRKRVASPTSAEVGIIEDG
jgi:O-antigen/teichoic acid export membrane protein